LPKNYYNNQLVLELDFKANISRIMVNSYQDLPVKVGDSIIHIFANEGLTNFFDSFSQTLNGNISLGEKTLLYNYEEVFMFMLKGQNEITFFTLSVQEEIMNLFDEIIKVNNDQMKSIRNLYKKLSNHEENYGFLEEIMLVNNGLINTRRELSSKNNELEKLNNELKELSNIDYLTKIGNRRRFFTEVYQFVQTCDYDLTIIDINNFKMVNDLSGHIQGDKLLCHFAN